MAACNAEFRIRRTLEKERQIMPLGEQPQSRSTILSSRLSIHQLGLVQWSLDLVIFVWVLSHHA